jgi:hypothetical protein
MLWQTKLIGVPPEKADWLPRALIAILSQAALFGVISCRNPASGNESETTKPNYTRWYIADENDYSPEEWQDCLNTLERLSLLGITLPERFRSLRDAKYIAEQRNKLANKAIIADKPVTIVMYPYYDTTGAFSGRWNSLVSIMAREKQQMLYFEIGGDTDLKAALRLLKDNLPAEQRLTLILAGHGTNNVLRWGSGSSSFYLDPTDYTDQEFINLLRGLHIELAIFESCSAGEGGATEQNQANRLAAHVRVGGRIIAPLVDALGVTYTFGKNDFIQDARYSAWTTNPSGQSDNIAYYADGLFVP